MLPANFFKCFRSKNTVFEPAQIINYSSNILNSPLVPVQSAQEIEEKYSRSRYVIFETKIFLINFAGKCQNMYQNRHSHSTWTLGLL